MDPKQQIETVLVEVVVALRDAFLRACSGRPPLSYWDQISNRLLSAARTSATAGEWATSVQRGLRVGAPRAADSLLISRLVALCDENDWHLRAMEHIEREQAFIVALARQVIEERKLATESKQAGVKFDRESIEQEAREHGLLEES